MKVAQALEAMRKEVAGCNLVAFADLSSRLVLSASPSEQAAREEMDALSEAAHDALAGVLAEGAASVLGADQPDTALLMTSTEARVILRSPDKPSEALVCLCEANVDFAAVLEQGAQAFELIGSGE